MIRRSVLLYFASFLVLGLALSVLGPALTQLRERSATGIGGIGVLFVGQSLGYIVGSFAAGRVFDRFDGHRVFAIGMCILGAGLGLVASFDSLSALFGVFVVIGFGGASIDVGANTLIVWELRDSVGRSMNALHLCFGLGALSAPLLVHVGLTAATRSAAVICVALAVCALAIPAPAVPGRAREEHSETTPRLLVMFALFFFLYVGLEIGFAGWIHTYGEEIQFSDLAATWLTTTFWLGFTSGRVLASALANRVAPHVMLVASCGLTIVAAVGLIVGDGREAPRVGRHGGDWCGYCPAVPRDAHLHRTPRTCDRCSDSMVHRRGRVRRFGLPVGDRTVVRRQRSDRTSVGDAAARRPYVRLVRSDQTSP